MRAKWLKISSCGAYLAIGVVFLQLWVRTLQHKKPMPIDIEEYIASGIIYDYCAGLLPEGERAAVERMVSFYPEVRAELHSVQETLEQNASQAAMPLPPDLKDKIWGVLDNLGKEQKRNPEDLPLINKYSSVDNWRQMVLPMLPAGIPEGTDVQMLRNSDGITQMLISSSIDVPDEVHENERESFFVLEGNCRCNIGEKQIELGPGGYIEIPMHEHHHVEALSPRVVAILQRIAV